MELQPAGMPPLAVAAAFYSAGVNVPEKRLETELQCLGQGEVAVVREPIVVEFAR
jgi:hypothetical protein